MASGKIVIDLETQREFAEVGGREHLDRLGISLAGVYDYVTDEFYAFEESELGEFEKLLSDRDHIIGFNVLAFDLPVLKPYLSSFDPAAVHVTDIMDDVTETMGYRLSLDNLAGATLGKTKTGSGLDAIKWYRSGDIETLKNYCLVDVRLTRDLYDHGTTHGYILARPNNYHYQFEDEGLRAEHAIPVRWARKVAPEILRNVIQDAYTQSTLLKIDYVSSRTGEEEPHRKWRLVEVRGVEKDGFRGYCFLRKEERHFKYGRILDLRVQ